MDISPAPRKVVIRRASGAAVQEVEQAAGVVAVGVGEPDPFDVGGVDDGAEVAEEVPVGEAEPGIDDDGLGGV